MKKTLLLFVLAIVLNPEVLMAQGFLNKVANDYRQRNQQRTTQNNNQRNYYNVERSVNQRSQSSGTSTTLESNYSQQPRQPRSNNISSNALGNDKVVTLVVNGTGRTKEEATRNALRSAIEQAFGTFVSANTEVLNDELIKDEIVTVTTGNIKEYSELYCSSNGGNYDVSVRAIVSIGSLISYAQNKGMKSELAGASFAMNMKMRKLNKENELKAMDDLKHQLCIMANSGIFDYEIEIGDPHMATEKGHFGSDGRWTHDDSRRIAVDVTVKQLVNRKTQEFRNSFLKVLDALSLTQEEADEYKSAGVPFYVYYGFEGPTKGRFAFRNKYDDKTIMDIISFARCFFSIKDNLGHTFTPYIRAYEGEFYKYEFRGDFSEGGMRSYSSTIYYPSGNSDVIRNNTMPSFGGYGSYVMDDNLFTVNYKTGYNNVDYKCFVEIGLSSSMLFSQRSDILHPWRNYEEFMKHGYSVGKVYDEMKLSLFYNETEIEQLNSIQVDPILPKFNLEDLVRLY